MKEVVEISIIEAIPFLKERLNMSYITSAMNKSVAWFHSKLNANQETGYTFPFAQKDCDQLNAILHDIAQTCMEHLLEPHTVSTSKIVYSTYVSTNIKSLRECISMKYLREHYTTISENSWCDKIVMKKHGQYISCFTPKNVEQINHGIQSMADLLLSIKIVL